VRALLYFGLVSKTRNVFTKEALVEAIAGSGGALARVGAIGGSIYLKPKV